MFQLMMDILLSTVLGFVLMFPLGWLFGAMNWPVFHSWGLFHGAFVIAWPLLGLLSCALLRAVRTRYPGK